MALGFLCKACVFPEIGGGTTCELPCDDILLVLRKVVWRPEPPLLEESCFLSRAEAATVYLPLSVDTIPPLRRVVAIPPHPPL